MFTREKKIFMIVGFVTLLGVSVLFVDHFSGANRNTPAGPLDVDSLVDNGLVVSVFETNTQGTMTNNAPPRGTIGGGIEQLAQRGRQAFTDVNGHLEDLRQGIEPPAVAETVESGADAPEAEVPGLIMGRDPRVNRPDGSDRPEAVRQHLIAPGDTLWGLAQEYYGDGSLHKALAEYNRERLTANGQPRIGATLLIPERALLVSGGVPSVPVVVTPPATRPANTPAVAPQPRPEAATRMYEVKRGDTLSQISQRELGTARRWKEILELNADRLKEPQDIWVGMKLRLPAR